MYEGQTLADWFHNRPHEEMCHRIAREGGRFMTKVVKEHTPFDEEAEHLVHLKEEIHQKILVVYFNEFGERAYESGAESELSYALYVEHGTGLWGPLHAKYVIVPRRPGGWLSWVDRKTGVRMYARKVLHPGSPGAHMFAIGATLTEAEFILFSRLHLERWKHEVEHSNRKRVVYALPRF